MQPRYLHTAPMHVNQMHPFSYLRQTHSCRHADKAPDSQRVFTHQTCSSRSPQSTRCSWQRWWRLSQHVAHAGGVLSQHSHPVPARTTHDYLHRSSSDSDYLRRS